MSNNTKHPNPEPLKWRELSTKREKQVETDSLFRSPQVDSFFWDKKLNISWNNTKRQVEDPYCVILNSQKSQPENWKEVLNCLYFPLDLANSIMGGIFLELTVHQQISDKSSSHTWRISQVGSVEMQEISTHSFEKQTFPGLL